MKSEVFIDAVGDIRDEFIEKADTTPHVKSYGWVKWVAVAACLVAAVLIAVPALSGKTPSVPEESTPIDTTDNSQEQDNVDAHLTILERAEIAAEQGLLSGGSMGGPPIGGGEYTYEMYVADYMEVTENPVFAALFESEETQQFDPIQLGSVTSKEQPDILERVGGTVDLVVMVFDGFSNPNVAENHVVIEHAGTQDIYADSFASAESNGIRNDYQVDEIEVQKYHVTYGDESGDYFERVCVNGEWYLAHGLSEDHVDTIATALAHVAAQM